MYNKILSLINKKVKIQTLGKRSFFWVERNGNVFQIINSKNKTYPIDIELFPGEDGDEDQWDIIFTDGANLFNSVYLPKSGIFTFIKNIDSEEYFNDQIENLLKNYDLMDDLIMRIS